MSEINIEDYFVEIVDEGGGTIGYDCITYRTNELVHKIYKQNDELKQLEQENQKFQQALKEIKDILSDNVKLRTKGLGVEIHPEHIFLMEVYNKINEVIK